MFTGRVRRRVHIGFEDPACATGSQEDILAAFRKVRSQMAERLQQFYREEIKPAAPHA